MPALLDNTVVERDVFRLVNDLPDVLIGLFWPVMQLGTLFAPYVLGTVAVLAGRVRMGLSLMVAGTVAWMAPGCSRTSSSAIGRPAS